MKYSLKTFLVVCLVAVSFVFSAQKVKAAACAGPPVNIPADFKIADGKWEPSPLMVGATLARKNILDSIHDLPADSDKDGVTYTYENNDPQLSVNFQYVGFKDGDYYFRGGSTIQLSGMGQDIDGGSYRADKKVGFVIKLNKASLISKVPNNQPVTVGLHLYEWFGGSAAFDLGPVSDNRMARSCDLVLQSDAAKEFHAAMTRANITDENGPTEHGLGGTLEANPDAVNDDGSGGKCGGTPSPREIINWIPCFLAELSYRLFYGLMKWPLDS